MQPSTSGDDQERQATWTYHSPGEPVRSWTLELEGRHVRVTEGAPGEDGEVTLFTLITAVHGIFQHANLQLRLGPLNHFFSMAELHRWHHSKTVDEANHNYGQTVIVWDTLFGTRFLPADREPPEEIGIANLPAFPMTWWAQIRSPFRWARIRRESAEASGAGNFPL